MLSFLRKKKVMKRILWALALIITPAFVFWGAGNLSKRRLPFKYIGTIEGQKISVDKFVKSIKDIQVGLFLKFFSQPQALDKIQKDRPFLNRLAWENLMLKVNARNDKVTVSDGEVVGFIKKHPLFTRGEVFDDKLYKYILQNTLGMTPRAFEESVRDFLVNAKYKSGIVKDATVSDEEVLRSYKNESEKAKVYYVIINKKDFKERVKVSENEIASFYEKNKELFREPEKVVLQYIAFPHKEEAAREKALTDLKRAYEKLRKRPRNMGKICRRLGLAIKETLPFSQNEIIPEIESTKGISIVSFKLKPLEDILPLVSENERGISYIIRVKEKIPSRIKSKREVSSYITDVIKDEKALDLAKREAHKIYKKAKADNMSLGKIAKIYNLKLRQTGLISRFDYIEEVGESYKIVETAFRLKLGEIAKPIEIRKGFALIETKEFLPIDEEKFEKEKEDYKNKVLSVKKIKALEDWLAKVRINSSLNVDLNRI